MESLDRRLFLRGLMLTSAGAVVPRRIYSIPAIVQPQFFELQGTFSNRLSGAVPLAYETLTYAMKIVFSEEAILDCKLPDIVVVANGVAEEFATLAKAPLPPSLPRAPSPPSLLRRILGSHRPS